MKKGMVFLCAVAFIATAAWAAGPAQYQVTGNVVDVKDDVIVVQKGNEKFEIARDKAMGADLKVGSKVTVFYTMKAEKVEVKEGMGGMKPEMPKMKKPTMPKM